MWYNAIMNRELNFPTSERVQIPEPLSFEEMANLVASLDLEPKCILLAGMNNGQIYNRSELNRVMIDIQGKDPGWVLSERMPLDYCKSSFEPIGLVAGEVVDKLRGTIGFAKTPYGSRVGTAMAGLLMDFSRSHDIALYNLLGATSSSSNTNGIVSEGQLVVLAFFTTPFLPPPPPAIAMGRAKNKRMMNKLSVNARKTIYQKFNKITLNLREIQLLKENAYTQ